MSKFILRFEKNYNYITQSSMVVFWLGDTEEAFVT